MICYSPRLPYARLGIPTLPPLFIEYRGRMAEKRGLEALRVRVLVIGFLLILIMQSSRNEVHSRRFTLTLSAGGYIFAYTLMRKSQSSLGKVNGDCQRPATSPKKPPNLTVAGKIHLNNGSSGR